ncbi:fasciclin domain-containing protein [Thalassotalea euphylliae]|uniref:fasciclin domain-containing protein n=1 Tax=Thalassotalea euphylliae TaxID=1655234 RepID=UPI003625F967
MKLFNAALISAILSFVLVSDMAVAAGPANNAKFEYTPNAKERLIREQGLTTLVQVIHAAGMVDALRTDGPYTLFAPNNEAFAKLPAGTLDHLLKPENKEQLVALLSRHVVEGEVMANEVVTLGTAQSLSGKTLDIAVNGNNVMVGNATVVKTDIVASNGVVHVIDTVLVSN